MDEFENHMDMSYLDHRGNFRCLGDLWLSHEVTYKPQSMVSKLPLVCMVPASFNLPVVQLGSR